MLLVQEDTMASTRLHPFRAVFVLSSFAVAAALAQTPVPSSVFTLRGSQNGDDGVTRSYRAFQNPGDVFRIVCSEPCAADLNAIYGLYAGFQSAHQTIVGLFGVDSLANQHPFDLHIDENAWCGPAQPGLGGDSSQYAYFPYSGMASGSYGCFWFTTPGHYALPFHYPETSTVAYQLLTAHEFTHTEFFVRHHYSYEDFAKAVSFYVSGNGDGPPLTDACADALNRPVDGRLIWLLCHESGFQWPSLAPAFASLSHTYDQGKGAAYQGETSVWQFRKALNAVLGKDTLDAFLAAKASQLPQMGDNGTLPYNGGRLAMLGGWVSLSVPIGTVTSNTLFHVDGAYVLNYAPPGLWTFENVYEFSVPGKTFLHFEEPAYLQVKYDPSLLPVGTDESTLAFYLDNGSSFVRANINRVDPTKHIVSTELTSAQTLLLSASTTTVTPTTVIARVLSTSVVHTRVVLRNAGYSAVSGTMRFHPSGVPSSPTDPSLPYALDYAKTLELPDAVAAFGATGAGSIDVVATAGPLPDVLATEIDATSGYVGSIVPFYSPAAGLRTGEKGYLVAPGNLQDESFRFVIRTFASGIAFTCVARDASGTTIATTTHSYAANTQFLVLPRDLAGGHNAETNESYEIDVQSGSALILTETSQSGMASHNYRIAERIDPEASTAGDALHLPKAVSATNPDGSVLRTSVQMTNPTNGTLTGTVRFLPADGSSAAGFHYSIPPYATRIHSDIVGGLGHTGGGALDITSSAGMLPVALARIIHSGGGQPFQAAEEQTQDVMERLQAGDRILLAAPVSTSSAFTIGVRTFSKELALTITINTPDGFQLKQISKTIPAQTTSETAASTFLEITPGGGDIIEIFVDGGGGLIYGTASNPATGAVNYQSARRLPFL